MARFSPAGQSPIRSSRSLAPNQFRSRSRRPNQTSGPRRPQILTPVVVSACAAAGAGDATDPGCGRATVHQRTGEALENRRTVAAREWTRPRSPTSPSATPGPAAGREVRPSAWKTVARRCGRRLRRVPPHRCRRPSTTGTVDSAMTGVRVAVASAAVAATVAVAVAVAAVAAGPGRTARAAETGTPRKTAKATVAVPVGRPVRRPRRRQRTRTAGRRRRLCSGHRPRSCCCPRPGAGDV